MQIAMLGGTGRTGGLVIDELLRRGHRVSALSRTAAPAGDRVRVVRGDVRDHAALREVLTGADAVCSALGPRRGDTALGSDAARALIEVMHDTGVRRFVGVSGAGIGARDDRKSRRDRVLSALVQGFGGATVQDRSAEYAEWSASGLDWTLVRPPRLVDGSATGRVEHAASTSPRRTGITRADLALFLVDVVEQGLYLHAAPLVAGA